MSDSARRPFPKKPSKLKSDVADPSAKAAAAPAGAPAKDAFFADLFGRADADADASLPATQSKPAVESIRVQPTLSTPAQRMPEVTSPSKLNSPRPAKKSKAAPVPLIKQKTSSNTPIRIALVLLLLGVVWFGTQGRDLVHVTPESAPLQALSPQEMATTQKRIELHREEIGHRLNRERITVEYQNNVTAPPIRGLQKPPAEVDMMAGAPLKPEGLHRSTSRDRLEPLNPDYADARIQYSLQEQAAANDWEKKAQKQYVDEFVANAAKAGFKIKVDKDGVVKVIGQVPPTIPPKPYGGEVGPLPRDPSSASSVR